MIVTNQTVQDYWFGPLHLPGGVGTQLTVDDTTATSLYLTEDSVADSINNLAASGKIVVTSAALPFPRPTGTPSVLHGDGSPEGIVYAPQGSLYLRRDNTGGNSVYSKTTPITVDTGWLAMASIVSSNPVGTIISSACPQAPTGTMLCDGSAVSRSTYATLFAALCPSLGAVTITIASPAVCTLTNHGLVAGDRLYFTTTGSLPTGLSANTIYYVIAAGLTANNFEISATDGGSAINTSGGQSGTHSLVRCPWGLGDGSTTFNIPDGRGRQLAGVSLGGKAPVAALGKNEGLTYDKRSPDHYHTVTYGVVSGSGNFTGGPAWAFQAINTSGDSDNLNHASYIAINYYIQMA